MPKPVTILRAAVVLLVALCGPACTAPAQDTATSVAAPSVATSRLKPSSEVPEGGPAPEQPVVALCSSGPRDVQVVVDTASAPLGGPPKGITNKLYSMNVDDQRAYDYAPNLNASYTALLAALKPALLRWPSGYYSQTYQFSPDAAGAGALSPDLIDGFLNLCHAVGAKPLMAINTTTGTPQNAALLVKFVNQTRGYGVAWWQLGNEPDVDGQDATRNPNAYAKTFQAFRSAMRAVDSNIKFVGAELFTGAHIMGGYSPAHPDWLTPILAATQNTTMDAIAWHHYPLDSSETSTTSSAVPTTAHALQETAQDWPPSGLDFMGRVFPRLHALRAAYAPQSELWVDEVAEDSGVANGAGISDRLVGALWTADALGRFAEEGADALFRYTFKGGAEHKYSLIDEDDQPRPAYYSYWLYAQHFGDLMVKAVSDNTAHVAAHASLRAQDQSLRLVLVNKTTASKRVHVNLGGFAPTRARAFVLSGDRAEGALATSVSLNGAALTVANIGRGQEAIAPEDTSDACGATVLVLPPLSVTLRVYDST